MEVVDGYISPHLIRRAKQEKAHRIKLKQYQGDFTGWLTNRFQEPASTVQWSAWGQQYEHHQWDGTPDPFLAAVRALEQKRWCGIESGTSTGKTYLLPRIVYWFLDVYPNSLVVTTAPKSQQLKAVLWSEMGQAFKQFRKLHRKSEMFTLRVYPGGRSKLYHTNATQYEYEDEDDHSTSWQAIGVVSGVRADEESATKMQGYHREHMLFVIDECPGVSPAVITAIKNTCTAENNLVVAVGNPDSVTDALHQFCELPQVEHVRISAFDHPNVVLGRTVIPGAVTAHSIENRELEYGTDSNFYNSRVRGISPQQATDSLINYEWVVACCKWKEEFDNNILDQNLPDTLKKDNVNAIGVDVANSENGDKACLVYGKRNVAKFISEFQCPDANAIADNLIYDPEELTSLDLPVYSIPTIFDYDIDPRHVGVDVVGVGVGTVNEFKRLKYQVKSLHGGAEKNCIPVDREGKQMYEFPSLRAQMLFQLRLDFMRHEFILDLDDPYVQREIVKQCTLIKYRVTDKNIVVESKEKIKKRLGGKSPNILDALAYWNWMRKDRKLTSSYAPFLVK